MPPEPPFARVIRLAKLLDRSELRGLSELLEHASKAGQGLAGMFRFLAGPEQPNGEDPYQVLGITRTDPPAMAQAVFKAKSKLLHPDVPGTGNAEAFRRLQAAYDRIKKGVVP